MITARIDCVDLASEMAWFRDQVGLRIHLVSPADDPRRVVLHGDSGAVELRRGDTDQPGSIVMEGSTARRVTSPGGTVVDIVSNTDDAPVGDAMTVPTNRPTLAVVDESSGTFGIGRAGMEYRDLLPDRWGGRFIASHIHIAAGGAVDDWVHFHRIRFQMIYVAAGWVDVVYEDQGDPFRMHPGDCVVQPPEIRHRVLRSSPGLEVIEIGCPAEHDTIADHDLDLPNASVDRARVFSGQRFVHHIAQGATQTAWVDPSMSVRDTGIARATSALAGVGVIGPADGVVTGSPVTHDGEFVMVFGLAGSATLDIEDRDAGHRTVTIGSRSSVAIPPGATWRWAEVDEQHEALVVEMPAGAIRLA